MYWQEKSSDEPGRVPDDIVDLAYRIRCRCLPLEHAYALSHVLHQALPWLHEEQRAGIHVIHGADSGNGWMRPQDPQNELLHLSHRTRMTLRLPRHRLDDARELTGKVLDIDGYPLAVGESAVRPLSTSGTIFSRYVVDCHDADEETFMRDLAGQLAALEIPVRKLLCGRGHVLSTPEGNLFARSVMLADMEREESVKLQRVGVGPHRKMGCGLFIPHKGIAPVMADGE